MLEESVYYGVVDPCGSAGVATLERYTQVKRRSELGAYWARRSGVGLCEAGGFES